MTFGDFKRELRAVVFPAGEAPNLVKAHDKAILDALIDIQTWVDCQQQDNQSLHPQCSTFYKCGLTYVPAPPGIIKKVQVVDKINPTTGLEDATADYEWCSAITYHEVPAWYMERYLAASRAAGGCLPAALFFGLYRLGCQKGAYAVPVPTGDGNAGLPALPLGFNYPESSTDGSRRAQAGVWAKDRGNIILAPWIQSTEQVVIVWDGIKRTFTDADPISENPLISKAVQEWLRWDHYKNWDKDYDAAAAASVEYKTVLANLMHECREETRQREENSSADTGSGTRGGIGGGGGGPATLFYNDVEGVGTAECPQGTTGESVTVRIGVGIVGSFVSVADANQKAQDQAQQQAQDRLDCTTIEDPDVYNTVAGSWTATCGEAEPDYPAPEGDPVTVVVEIGTVPARTVELANQLAQQMARTQAEAEIVCTFWNKAGSVTATCPGNDQLHVSKDYPAHIASSTESYEDADAKAAALTLPDAQAELHQLYPNCLVPSPQVTTVRNVTCSWGGETAPDGGGNTGTGPAWVMTTFILAAGRFWAEDLATASRMAHEYLEAAADDPTYRNQACYEARNQYPTGTATIYVT